MVGALPSAVPPENVAPALLFAVAIAHELRTVADGELPMTLSIWLAVRALPPSVLKSPAFAFGTTRFLSRARCWWVIAGEYAPPETDRLCQEPGDGGSSP
jgi:hypothetical protein